YGGAGHDWIWAYVGYSSDNVEKNSTAGWTSEIHGGDGNDYLFAQVETNDLYGDAGDDNFYAYIDQKTTVSDSEGTDTLNMFDTQTDDASKDNLHVMFNVAAGYDYDSNNAETLFNGNVFVTGTATKANYDLWTSGGAFAGVSVVGNAVETIKSSDNWTLSKENISVLAESVAGWLTTNGYGNVGGVFSNALEKSAEDSAADIQALIVKFDEAAWASPNP
ncbi:MAG: hypothetical protein K6E29_01135, partial [Cyanobacteria bacterium RUI128]|nr:hypothetical protein [Cyanobacteria bacterium RUI128]